MLFITLIYGPINRWKRNKFLVKKVYSLLVSNERSQFIKNNQNGIKAGNDNRIPVIQNNDSSPKSPAVRQISAKQMRINKFKRFFLMKTGHDPNDDKHMQVLNRIDESMDVLKLVRDLNLLKVMTHVILRQRHLGLAQLVGFDLWSNEKKEEFIKEQIFQEKSKQKPFYKREKVLHELKLQDEVKQYPEWIEQIEDNLTDQTDALQEKKEIEKFVDYFYHCQLSQNKDEA